MLVTTPIAPHRNRVRCATRLPCRLRAACQPIPLPHDMFKHVLTSHSHYAAWYTARTTLTNMPHVGRASSTNQLRSSPAPSNYLATSYSRLPATTVATYTTDHHCAENAIIFQPHVHQLRNCGNHLTQCTEHIMHHTNNENRESLLCCIVRSS